MSNSSTMNIIITKTPIIDYCNYKPNNINNHIYKRFIDDLNIDRKKDMTLFLNNIDTIRIKNISKDQAIYSASAQYSMDNNTIEIINENSFDNTIDHELLHVSSTFKEDEENIYSGFFQNNGNNSIGVGLNEGYTSLLDDRYFINRTESKYLYNCKVYQVVKVLAKRIEEFIGKENMEDFYFSADLFSLCNILANYTSKLETINFLQNIDIILLKYELAKIKNYPLCFKKYSECMLYICEAWMYRISEGFINKQITREEYEFSLNMIKELLNSRLKIRYSFISSIKLDKYYPIMQNKVNNKLIRKKFK